MSIYTIKDIFSQEEIGFIDQKVANSEKFINNELGRLQIENIRDALNNDTVDRLDKIVKDLTGMSFYVSSVVYVEYNGLYGKPILPPHVDGDKNDLILNVQLESNTDWEIGLNLKTYKIEDNSALLFNPNKEIHWRVHKEFKDGEYVRMLFIRLFNPESRTDYSYLPKNQDHEMFKEARAFRDSYPQANRLKIS
jgi:hypothetical protein